mmetsp:Transcript_40305/g.124517  ORF Transcript_40305/g.124517 Transcript_40305/m.124517 type:complete len:372 (-) Transcript_40305:1284-2399(-)
MGSLFSIRDTSGYHRRCTSSMSASGGKSGHSVTIACSSSCRVAPAKGSLPKRRRKRTTPALHMSAAGVGMRPCVSSGAAKAVAPAWAVLRPRLRRCWMLSCLRVARARVGPWEGDRSVTAIVRRRNTVGKVSLSDIPRDDRDMFTAEPTGRASCMNPVTALNSSSLVSSSVDPPSVAKVALLPPMAAASGSAAPSLKRRGSSSTNETAQSSRTTSVIPVGGRVMLANTLWGVNWGARAAPSVLGSPKWTRSMAATAAAAAALRSGVRCRECASSEASSWSTVANSSNRRVAIWAAPKSIKRMRGGPVGPSGRVTRMLSGLRSPWATRRDRISASATASCSTTAGISSGATHADASSRGASAGPSFLRVARG